MEENEVLGTGNSLEGTDGTEDVGGSEVCITGKQPQPSGLKLIVHLLSIRA